MVRFLSVLQLFLGSLSWAFSNDTVGFLFFGDFGTGSSKQLAVAKAMQSFCKSHQCDFIAGLGDNIYEHGVTSVEDPKWQSHVEKPYAPLGLKMFASLGNHDYEGDVLAQIKYSSRSKIWEMPDRHYQFKKGPAQFFVVDTNQFDYAQTKLLRNLLRGSTACWKIVYGHHPIHSYGMHGSTKELLSSLKPLLLGEADFYLSGHDHDKQAILADDGVVYLVSGAAGGETREVKSGPGSLFQSSNAGFAHLLIRQREATLKFVSETGKIEFERSFSKPSPKECRF